MSLKRGVFATIVIILAAILIIVFGLMVAIHNDNVNPAKNHCKLNHGTYIEVTNVAGYKEAFCDLPCGQRVLAWEFYERIGGSICDLSISTKSLNGNT